MFDFMKYRWLFFGISLVVIIPGLISLATNGLRPGIDFTGGSLLEIRVDDPSRTQALSSTAIPETLSTTYEVVSVQSSGNNQLVIKGKVIDNQTKDVVLAQLVELMGPVTELRFETVGPILGRELITKTLVAVGLSATIITLYVSRRFDQLKYGVSAVLALIHDILVLLGVFSLLGKFYQVEVDILFVTAVLTTVSFSVHDTVVVYDRIRESHRKFPRVAYSDLLNNAVLQTLSRSLNNSITIIIMLLALVLLGGQSIRWFSVALLVGAVTGTYSSTFTAVPLLLLWDNLADRWRRRRVGS